MEIGVTRHFDPNDPNERYEHVRDQVIRPLAGKTGATANSARLFLLDIMELEDEGSSTPCVFPIKVGDVRVLVSRLISEMKSTSLNRISIALDALRSIGCDVPPKDSHFGFPATSLPKTGKTTKRACPPPMWVAMDEGWAAQSARDPDGRAACPHSDFVSHSVIRRRIGDRGMTYHESRFMSAAEIDAFGVKGFDTSKFGALICRDNKSRKLDNVQVFPHLSLLPTPPEVASPICVWTPRFVAAHARLGFMFVDYELNPNHVPAPKKPVSIEKPCRWVTCQKDPSGFRPCSHDKAVAACSRARAMSCGLSVEQMAEMKLSGDHADRNIAPEVTARAGWPEEESDILGDWATPEGGTPRDPALARPGSGRSARKAYIANHSLKAQLNARMRYALLLRAAFQLYESNGGRLTWETTWQDLLPKPPPPELERFYGRQADDLCPEVDPSAAFAGAAFEAKARPSRRQPSAAGARKRSRAQ